MSRGLGWVQRAILGVLGQKEWYRDGYLPITELTVQTYHPERFDEVGDCYDWSYTRSEFVSIHRAVQSLEERGLIETKAEQVGWRERPFLQHGGISHRKRARLSVDTKESFP